MYCQGKYLNNQTSCKHQMNTIHGLWIQYNNCCGLTSQLHHTFWSFRSTRYTHHKCITLLQPSVMQWWSWMHFCLKEYQSLGNDKTLAIFGTKKVFFHPNLKLHEWPKGLDLHFIFFFFTIRYELTPKLYPESDN